MKILLRILQLAYMLYAAVLFVAGLLVVFPVALFAAPFGARRGGNVIYKASRVWASVWLALCGIRHHTSGALPEEDEDDSAYVFIANHISWLDAALIPVIFRRPLRPLGKAEVGKIPLFGFIYRRAVITVDRSSPEARQRSVKRLASLLRKRVSVLVFPEGTFNETGEPLAPFFDGAFRIAIETGTPIKPVLLLDTYARMPYYKSLSLNPGRSRAVFLETIPVAGLTPDDVPILRQRAYQMMTEKLIALHAEWIGAAPKKKAEGK